jgi:hypothetical protein
MTVQASDVRALRRLVKYINTKFSLDPIKREDLTLEYRVSNLELAVEVLIDLKYSCGKDYFQGWTQPWSQRHQQ